MQSVDPPPASHEARIRGCICNPFINRCGKGEVFHVDSLCPLHGLMVLLKRESMGRSAE
jgi:hypothetical protein